MIDSGIISSALIGGLIFEAFKYGGKYCVDNIKDVIKDLVLDENEKEIIATELINATVDERNSKESLEKFIENKAVKTMTIIEKYNNTQNLTIQKNEHGDNFNNSTVTKNVHNTILPKAQLKKH